MRICAFFVTVWFGAIICQISQTHAARVYEGMAFHPITQDQYDAILGLTAGEPVISEARLIASGIAALKGIAAGLKIGLTAGWLPSLFAGFGGSQRNATKDILNLEDGYPLCVVKQEHEDEEFVHGAHNEERDNEDSYERPNGLTVGKCVVVVKEQIPTTPTPTPTTTEPPPIVDTTHFATHENYPHYPPYPYPYPWYNNGYYPSYHPQYDAPYGYEQEYYDFEPNFRHYSPSSYENPPHKSNYQSSSMSYKQKYATKSHKLRGKNRKPNPAPANYYDYTAPPRTTRTKTKRDQHSTPDSQENYHDVGYQPASYPQVNYHTQYPKISYSPSYNYQSPVYVGTTPRPVYAV